MFVGRQGAEDCLGKPHGGGGGGEGWSRHSQGTVLPVGVGHRDAGGSGSVVFCGAGLALAQDRTPAVNLLLPGFLL